MYTLLCLAALLAGAPPRLERPEKTMSDAAAKHRENDDAASADAAQRARAEVPTRAPAGPLNDAARRNREGVDEALDVAVVAGGCFWGLQELLRALDGVVRTDVGYSGGRADSASYERVHLGTTGHAESVRVVFDPKRLSYERLVTYFFRIHDPTTPNRQGNDFGTQYRSVIFAQTADQRRTANAVKERLTQSDRLEREVVTRVVAATPYVPAEDEHQDYLRKHPGGYTCHYERKFEF